MKTLAATELDMIIPEIRKQYAELDKMAKEGEYFKFNHNHGTDELMGVTEHAIKEFKKPLFVYSPNSRLLIIPVLREDEHPFKLDLVRTSENEVYFFNQVERFRADMRYTGAFRANAVRYLCHIKEVHKEESEGAEFCSGLGTMATCVFLLDNAEDKRTLSDFRLGTMYWADSMKFRIVTSRKNANRYNLPTTDDLFIVGHFKEVRPDYKELNEKLKALKSFDELALAWNFDKDEPLYSSEENDIIFMNSFYMEPGVAAFNLFLCGESGTKKSSWLQMLEKITGDRQISATGARGLALVPSFYGDEPNPGELMKSKFISLIDEINRKFSQDKKQSSADIRKGLESIMNILDRKPRKVSTGKSKSYDIDYRASFFATDNLGFKFVYRAIQNADEAVLRRIWALMLSEESEDNARSVSELNDDEYADLVKNRLSWIGFSNYFALLQGCREMVKKVNVDSYRVELVKLAKEIYEARRDNNEVELGQRAVRLPNDGRLNYGSIINAVAKCVVVMDAVLHSGVNTFKELKFEERHIPKWKQLFARLLDDKIILCYRQKWERGIDIQAKMDVEASGLRRNG